MLYLYTFHSVEKSSMRILSNISFYAPKQKIIKGFNKHEGEKMMP